MYQVNLGDLIASCMLLCSGWSFPVQQSGTSLLFCTLKGTLNVEVIQVALMRCVRSVYQD